MMEGHIASVIRGDMLIIRYQQPKLTSKHASHHC